MKKAVLILLSGLMLFMSVPLSASATGFTEKPKLKSIVRAIGEKIGIAWNDVLLSNVTDRMIGQYNNNNGDVQYGLDWMGRIPIMSAEIVPDALEPQDLLLDSQDFLDGAKFIEETAKEFDGTEPLQLWRRCEMPSTHGFPSANYKNGDTTRWIYYNESGLEYIITYDGSAVTSWTNLSSGKGTLGIVFTGSYTVYYKSYGFWYVQTSGSNKTHYNNNTFVSSLIEGVNEGNCNYTPSGSDHIDTTGIPSTLIENYSNYENFNQFNITIVNNNDYSTTYNEPLTNEDIAELMQPVEPTEKPVGSSWWEWLLAPFKVIADFFKDVGGFLLGILVPSADSVTGIFNGISDSFKAKIPIADQLGIFFGEIEEIQATETPTAPTFDVTMPVEWGGGTFPMIDFSYFDQWRTWVLNFIRFTAWFIFLKRLYARIPRMVY